MFLPELKSKVGEDISILIKLDNYSNNFICECGDASELTVKECQNTEAIFISHTHIDHFIHFDFILRHQIGIQRKVIICGPEGITHQVQSKILGYQWNLIEENAITYEIREILNNGKIKRAEIRPPKWEIEPIESGENEPLYQNERFRVAFTILDHKTASIAYLFKENDTVKIDIGKSSYKGGRWIRDLKLAFENGNDTAKINIEEEEFEAKDLYHLLEIKKGDTLGIIMDHASSEENHQKIKELFTNCNQVFIESFYKAADKEFAKLNYHSYSEESARIMNQCKVQKAIPVHFSRKYNDEEISELLAEFNEALK